MSMTKGFSNVFRIPELRKKILITLGLVFVCRLVSQIPTPGVDWRAHGRIGDSNNEGDYYNLNIDMVPVNKNDVVYLEVLGYHYVDSAYTTSSYLNFGGFTVTYFPAN